MRSRLLLVLGSIALGGVVLAACGDSGAGNGGGSDGGSADATTASDAPASDPDGGGASDGGAASDAGATSDGGVLADADAGWTPANLVGLAIWLDGTRGVHADAGAVVGWDDQSGHNNNAATVTAAGTVTVSALDGGLSRAHFASGKLSIADAPSLQWGSTNDAVLSLVVALSTSTTPGNATFIVMKEAPATGVGPQIVYGVGGGASVNEYTAAPGIAGPFARAYGTYNDGALRVVSLRRRGATTVEVRVNGVPTSVGVDASTDLSGTGNPMVLGADYNNFGFLSGDIAELVGAAAPTISDADVGKLESYLSAKYGLALQADAGLP